jgi:murein L,D-transpeptidase YafK
VICAWLRAVLLSAAFAASLTPVRCLGQYGYVLPEKAIKDLSAELLSLLQQKSMPKNSRILLRIFKEESELELWNRTLVVIIRSSRPTQYAAGQATLVRSSMKAMVRLPKASIRLQ